MKFVPLHYLLFLGVFCGCSTQGLNNKIETSDADLLKEESLMRYSSNRFEIKKNAHLDLLSTALVACHEKKIMKGLDLLKHEMFSQKLNPFYWNALGTCYFLSGHFSKALFFYDIGLESLTTNQNFSQRLAEATLNNNIGLIHLNFKRFSKALESFKKAGVLLPDSFTPQFNMAQLYIEFNENDKAFDILKKMEVKNPNDIDLLYSLSLVYFRKNELDKSFATIQKIGGNYLNRPDIVGLYAYGLMKKNRLEEARELLEKRTFSDLYDQRNKMILEEIGQKLKRQKQN